MGRLFLDARDGWSDPAESGLMVLDGSGAWASPDDRRLALDATAQWSAPQLRPRVPESLDDLSWPEITRMADYAARDRETYLPMLGMEKTLTIDGRTCTARIVEVGKGRLRNGGVAGFTFNPYRGMAIHHMNADSTAASGYAETEMKTYLEGLAFQEDVAESLREFEVRYRPSTGASAQSLYSKFALMSVTNLFWVGCADISNLDEFYWPDEGEPYEYFKRNDVMASRIHYNDADKANVAWLLSPHTGTSFLCIDIDGRLGLNGAFAERVPAARFCLGSSI